MTFCPISDNYLRGIGCRVTHFFCELDASINDFHPPNTIIKHIRIASSLNTFDLCLFPSLFAGADEEAVEALHPPSMREDNFFDEALTTFIAAILLTFGSFTESALTVVSHASSSSAITNVLWSLFASTSSCSGVRSTSGGSGSC